MTIYPIPSTISSTIPSPIPRWHDAVAGRDLSGIEALLAPDVVFRSPAMHKPQVGPEAVARYLRAAMCILGDPSFRYTGEWFRERSAVLEFEVRIDGLEVNGVDLIHWNDDGLIVLFKVMVRPLRALERVIAAMGARLDPVSAP